MIGKSDRYRIDQLDGRGNGTPDTDTVSADSHDTGIDHNDITVEEVGAIRPKSKIAYALSTELLILVVSNSGHLAMLRGRDKTDYDYGGWCHLGRGRIWPTSGSVSNVPPKLREVIQAALENHFRVFLEWGK